MDELQNRCKSHRNPVERHEEDPEDLAYVDVEHEVGLVER